MAVGVEMFEAVWELLAGTVQVRQDSQQEPVNMGGKSPCSRSQF